MAHLARVARLACGTVLFLAALARPGVAQTGTLAGTVQDSAGNPIAGANVAVERTELRATTTSQGGYSIRGIPAGSQRLRARAIGFVQQVADVTVTAGETTRQAFILVRAPVQLAPIDVVVGSRAPHAAADELAVPVDVFNADVIAQQGTTETSIILQSVLPSANFPRQSVADADDIARPFTIRGLSPDQSLVLVNGRRRHHMSVVHVFAYGMAAGSSGVDLNAMPASMFDRIDVLRDGASAQYGSDAIAGVVNFVVKDGGFAPYVNVEAGGYVLNNYANDGTTVDINGGWGIKLGRGSLGLFAEYRHRNPTNRAWADNTDQITPGDADSVDANGNVVVQNNPVPMPNYHWGDGQANDIMTFANFRMPVSASGNTEVYAFGGYSHRYGTGEGFYRVGLDARNWPQIYPLGFLPRFAPDAVDVSVAGGLRGSLSGWAYDLALTYGRNGFNYNLENTLNVSLGPCLGTPCAPGVDGVLGTADDPGIPNQQNFFAGELGASEVIGTLDVSKSVHLGLKQPVNVAVGIAYRREYYQITAGELASYLNGGYPDQYGDIAPSGSQVFAGFQPADESSPSRGNFGAYVDLESNLTKQFLVDVAGRFENYSDFGSQLTGKLAMRYQPARQVVLRAAVNSGFRAPALSQSYYSSRTTTFILDTLTGRQTPVDFGIFPVNSAPAIALGAVPLQDETSISVSGGIVYNPIERLSFTVDGYYIHINDRIILTGLLNTDSVAAILANLGLQVGGAQYFTNALSTETFGIDVTADWTTPVHTGTLGLTLAFNYTTNNIVSEAPLPPQLVGTGVTTLFDPVATVALEQERPLWRATLSGLYTLGKFHGLARASGFGTFSSAQLGACEACIQKYKSKTLIDAEVGYQFNLTTLSVGVRNLFNVFPEQASLDNSFGVFPWPAASPFGYNGRYIYASASVLLY